MGFTEKMVTQARKPTGWFGRFMARAMNHGQRVGFWGLKYLPINKNYIVLDVGCGGGKNIHTMAKIANEGKVYGIDYSEDSVAVASKINKKLIDSGKVEIIHCNVESLPFPDNMFDLVTAVDSYYFWPDLIKNLKEIYRVLKPGGHIGLINEGYKHKDFEKSNAKWEKYGNFYFHTPEEFKSFLVNTGYNSVKINVLENKNWIVAVGTKG
jgi:ubiquinone/menaquinone biosynthesis C-methylase UbiE